MDDDDFQGKTASEDIEEIVSCRIINDFVAQGYGCLTLKPHEVKVLAGPKTAEQVITLPVGPKVCVGAGTGLARKRRRGEALLREVAAGLHNIMTTFLFLNRTHLEYVTISNLLIS